MYGSCLVKKESEGFIMNFEMNGTVLKKYRGAGGAVVVPARMLYEAGCRGAHIREVLPE